jgi:hypothetical protein
VSRAATLGLTALSVALLLPGLLMPVLTIRGVLTKAGVAQMAPMMLEKGLNDDTMKALKALMNPATVAMVEGMGGNLRKMIIDRLAPQLTKTLQSGEDVEVYTQTRSILGSVRQLYRVGSPVPATLILVFSVVVPFGKAILVAWSVFLTDEARRKATRFVELIAKWSMADVFVVAIIIAFLAAQASTVPPGDASAAPLLKFTASFGPGFYWFATYCVFSLGSQQLISRKS